MTDNAHPERLTVPRADDMHVHLRQGELMQLVAPLVSAGGVGRCLVMPNTKPPITSIAQAAEYRDSLHALAPEVDLLMTLYLTPELTPQAIRGAREAGVVGVKCYPRGVTTNSDAGVEDLMVYAGLFSAMVDEGLVLELHGEIPSNPELDVCCLNAEEMFLTELRRLHLEFPSLRIVLEHVTTAEAVDCVSRLGETVAATITAHHLDLTVDDWAGRNHNFCKPVAKYPHDRDALREVVRSGHNRFFLGSDSAPHRRDAKECACGCAGVFTAPLLLPYLADSFERIGCLDRLPAFAAEFGRRFYGLEATGKTVTLVREEQTVPDTYGPVVPYRAGETLGWRVAGR